MKECFWKKHHLSPKNLIKLEEINEIIEEYSAEGYVLTLRQLYYQLVSRGLIPNVVSEYNKLSSLLVKGRMSGLVDWSAIEDRLRVPYLPYYVSGTPEAMEDTINYYRLDRQRNQKTYVELWVEKDALSGVLRPLTSHYHINLVVNRGYSSCTAMYDAYRRFFKAMRTTKVAVLLYLGDHDPSGLDMIRDIQNRLVNEFLGGNFYVDVVHVGLTMEQVEKYNPPPNPAKITDPRAYNYIREYGGTSWEVDALPPEVLNQLIHKNIQSIIDMDKFQEILDKEEKDKKELEELKETLYE